MSMTSKVNPTLRQEIVDTLASRLSYGASNHALVYTFGDRYSLRSVQEATQKMTKDGTLIATRSVGFTFYKLNPAVPVKTEVGLAANQGL